MPARKNPAVDAYIEKSPEFARPILVKLRDLMHRACPEVAETLKWSVPFFDYKGPVLGIAAFKQHVNLVFWKGKLLKDPAGLLAGAGEMMNGSVIRLTSIADLPKDKVLLAYLAEAVALNEQGVKLPAKKKKAPKLLVIPPELQAVFKRNKTARVAFDTLSPSHQREYAEWIAEAKQPATRDRRVAKTLEQLAEGKSLNWKYGRKN